MNDRVNLPAVVLGELDRKTYLGSSDIAAIMGLSPWKTPLQVYQQKVGDDTDPIPPERLRLFKRGKRNEPFVLEDLIELYGVKVTKRSTPSDQNRYTDPEHAFMAAEIDFEWEVTAEIAAEFALPADLIGTIQNGEIKTVHPFAQGKFGVQYTDEIPIEYAAQGMYGMMVKGSKLCMFAVGVDANDPLVYFLFRDEETIAGMREKAVKFWFDHVLPRKAPDPINLSDMMRLFAKFNGRAVDLDVATAALMGELRKASDMRKSWDDYHDEVKFKIADFVRQQWGLADGVEPVDDARLMFEGQVMGTWKKQSSTRIDGDRLKKAEPEIAAEYSKTSWTRVFRLKKAAA